MCVLVQGAQSIISGSAAEGTQSLSCDHFVDSPCNAIPMCAPGSKEWRSRRALLFGLLALSTYAVAGLAVWHFLLAFGTQYEVQVPCLTAGPLASPGRFKTYASAEVLDEFEGLQRYVSALSAHDIHNSTNAFAMAAFDLVAQDPTHVAQGLLDVHAIFSPAQQHAHAMLSQCPLTWGDLAGIAENRLWYGTVVNNVSAATATVWLAARLPGAGKRASTGLREVSGVEITTPSPALLPVVRLLPACRCKLW